MLLFSLITDYSIFLLIPCLGIALLFSWFFYRRDESLSEIPKKLKWALRIIRFILISVIAFFLLSPMIRYFSTSVQKPVIILAVDNSESIALGKDSVRIKQNLKNNFEKLKASFGDKYEVQLVTFGDVVKNSDSLLFDQKHTDFSKLFSYVQATYSNRNVGAFIIASDGIYNSGSNPLYLQTGFKCPVYTILLGDTTHYKDLRIEDVIYNKVAFKGNNFSIKIISRGDKSKNENMQIHVKRGNETIATYKKIISTNDFTDEILFDIKADNPGLQHYKISITPIEGEITNVNNYRDIVVEVLDSKQKVLLLVNSPHPDAGAIKAALETNPNFDLTYSTGDAFKGNIADYNVVFLHQIPSKGFSGTQIIQNAINNHVPILFILGSQTSLSTFNRIETGLQINQTSQKYEEAYPALNNSFVQFQSPSGMEQILKDYPPLNVPFGDYKVKSGSYTLFQQKIKTISTSKPLVLFFDNFFESKVGIICGEGLWRWRLKDYSNNSNHEIFYELINKITQYLSIKIKKDKFNVTNKNIYPENESIIMGAELYNDNFEPVNDPDVLINIESSKQKKYPFTFNKTGQFYQLNAGLFPAGDYSFTASTQLGDKKFQKKGSFVIASINIESSKLIANKVLLEQLALKNNGKYTDIKTINQITQEVLSNKDITAVSYAEKKLTELIQLKWIFFALVLLFTIEWFVRKFYGSYKQKNMKTISFALIFISSVVIYSCSSSSITLNVLVPGDINVPQDIKRLAAINRSLPAKGEGFNNVVEGIVSGEGLYIDRDASRKCIDGVANGLSNSPRFTITVPGNLDLKGTGTAEWPIPIEWKQVDKICSDNQVDALLVLETFDSNAGHNVKTVNKKRTENGQEISYVEFVARLDIGINAGWRIYDPKNKRVIDQNVYTDHMAWEKDGPTEKDAVKLLPQQRGATMDAGYFAGQQYARRISPTWVNTSRSYYVKGNDQLKTAKRKVQLKQWNEAAELWQASLNDPKKKVGGRAAYNLALAAEVDGKLELAVEWAKKAYSDYGNKAARSYTNVLYQRQNDQIKLKQQMEGQ